MEQSTSSTDSDKADYALGREPFRNEIFESEMGQS